ncbi:MAG: hypothetical protein JWN44_628 [Myxococcales bacterium]|nr:hypothetical protein [Myxococcales bacterium]
MTRTPQPPWTEQKILREMLRLYRAGVALTQTALFHAGEHSLLLAINYFGGFPRLRRLAELPPPPRVHRRCALDEADVLAEIRRRHAAGEPLAPSKIPPALRYAGQRRFGSWRQAVTAAGFDYERIRLPTRRRSVG